MCGIAGIVDLENEGIDCRNLLAMTNALAHRGPDDEGYVLIHPPTNEWSEYSGAASPARVQNRLPVLRQDAPPTRASIGLGHRRFSIIDLSERGHQPFIDLDAGCCAVFNGEIYNYVEVRDELSASGVAFRTQSDTEVLVKAYARWGMDCFRRLNGFWAIALYDFRRRQLVLSRDRLGKRPLYWTRCGPRLYFASEIKALLTVDEVRAQRRPNRDALQFWLAEGRKDLNFSTCFEGIYSLPSASWMIVDEHFPSETATFWSVPRERMPEKDISVDEAALGLRRRLEDAVRIRLRADVPSSVELSGGLDSSVIVALAAQLSDQPITTYTVRFADPKYNEEPWARAVASRFATDYRVLDSPVSNFWRQIRAFTYLEEEPYHSPNLQTNQVIWSRMRAKGTKVSLNGAGGDEDFAGYSTYFRPAQLENLLRGRLLFYLNNGARYTQGRTNLRGLAGPIFDLAKSPADRKTLSEALYNDMTNTLMPYWLRSGDRGYMGIPLELRAPLLDYRVVDFAFRLPVTYLIRNGWHKWILRVAMQDLLPPSVLWRRRKMGFPFPFEAFYKQAEPILGILYRNASNPFIDASALRDSRPDWKVVSFLLWYEMFFNGNAKLFRSIEAKAEELNTAEDYGFSPEFLSSSGFAA